MLLGLTGGIATGKSTLARLLQEHGAFAFFDADACVHELLASDPDVISVIRKAFALAAPPIDRARLREIVFRDSEARHRLEAILHPAVRNAWQDMAEACRLRSQHFLADIPLLFETGADTRFDVTILVAASPETQRLRLAERGLGAEIIEGMLASQWQIGQKIPRADHVIWNDGSLAGLEQQASLLISQLFPLAA